MKAVIFAITVSLVGVSFAGEPAARAVVSVDAGTELGQVKFMNAVNNGPKVPNPGGDQIRGNFAEYKALRIPYARLHDSLSCINTLQPHCVDITAIFPDFDADENDPANYDFVFTDTYLNAIVDAGTKPFFRLGQSIEHGPKKYGVMPPKDFAKWARICERVIRHYNEGWGWEKPEDFKNQFRIENWEIWNEPDLDAKNDRWKTNPRTWGGSPEQFFDFYEVAAKHLKAKFPQLNIGGPAVAGVGDWAERFVAEMAKRSVSLDFFSWHIYSTEPEKIAAQSDRVRKILDANGYTVTKSILNEWNYVKGWRDDFAYSIAVEQGGYNLKCAAFIASTMISCQNKPVDMLMFYDARNHTAMNALFDIVSLNPIKGYYSFYAWSKLLDRGTQVATKVDGARGYYATAAKGKDGSLAILIARYNEDNNVTDTGAATISVPGRDLSRATCHLTDSVRTYTEVPLARTADGNLSVKMEPLSFALVEIP